MKRICMHKKLALLGMTVLFSVAVTAQNMDRYITLKVKPGQQIGIELSLLTDSDVVARIVSGSTDVIVPVEPYWFSQEEYYLAGDETMTIYGDFEQLDCKENGANITGLDATHNDLLSFLNCSNCEIDSLNVKGCVKLTALYCMNNKISELDISNCPKLGELFCCGNQISELNVGDCPELIEIECNTNNISSLDVTNCRKLIYLGCYRNPLTTEVLDQIYCDLVDKQGDELQGYIIPLYDENDSIFDAVMQTNKENAVGKNWRVTYKSYDDIPATTGNFECHIGIEEPAFAEDAMIQLAPNPARTSVTISVDKSISGKTLEIFDIFGRLVYRHETQIQQDISVADWPDGIYFVKIGVSTTKLVKN